MPTPDLGAAAALLRNATEVTLLAHVNPDADALGSALALGLALRRRGVDVCVSFGMPNDVPESLRVLDVAGLVVPAAEVPAAPALLIVLDTASKSRLGQLADRVNATAEAGGAVLVLDHHASNTFYGTHHVVDEAAEATAVLVLRLFDELAWPLEPDVARCVYAGLVTDTSSFRRATPDTHRLAARLIEAGVDPTTIARDLMDTHPFAFLQMLAGVLDRAVLEPDAAGGHGFVHTAVRLDDLIGVRLEEVESVVDIVRTTAEAEVAAVLKEISSGHWTGSLRAVGKVDVRAVAEQFGGGGHRLAAGFSADGELEDVITKLREALRDPVLLASG